MGPVAGPQQYRDIRNAICRAQTDGARMVAEATRRTRGLFHPPTVFTGVRCDMELFREEIFGPVLAVSEFDSLDDALKLANESIYGCHRRSTHRHPRRAEVHRWHRGRPRARQCAYGYKNHRCRLAG
jgi:acyl-CoA reductase-like NAD-dependent aldehyde dehydrogenase